jgi:hypothetical protein
MITFAENVEAVAWHDAEEVNGELFDTCAEGTVCRERSEAAIKEEVFNKWEKVVNDFKSDVHDAVLGTEALVSRGWQEAV